MSNPIPIPVNDAFVNLRDWDKYPSRDSKDPQENRLTRVAIDWLQSLTDQATNTAVNYPVVSDQDQNANIGTTTFPTQPLSAGLYRLTFYSSVTTAATTSSDLTVTFSWIEDGITKSATSTGMSGNTTTTTNSGTYTVYIDAGTPITYATTYSSNGAGEMVYSLRVALEGLGQ